jgi:glycosyltransferase involved in cell wall biosynthesis
MKIWIVSLFDPTVVDNTRPMRFMSLAKEAERLGHEVTYFSNVFRHATKKNRVESAKTIISSKKYRTVFVDSLAYKNNISIKRFYSHYIYAKNLINKIQEIEEKPDVIVSALPPIFVNVYLSKWALIYKVRFYLDIIDPWPDTFKSFLPKSLRPLSNLIFSPYRSLISKILNRSAGVISISNQYLEWAKKFSQNKMQQVHLAYPSVDISSYQEKIVKFRQPNLNRPLTIVYAGNLGHLYDIPCILEAAKELERAFPGKTRFIIAGLGYFEKDILKYTSMYPNITYLGRIDHDELMRQYANSDLGLAQYGRGATQSVTYKLFDYLGSGLPVLNSLQSEMAKIIEDNRLGFNNQPGNFTELVKNIKVFFDKDILMEFKSRALEFARTYGDNTVVYKSYIDFISRK